MDRELKRYVYLGLAILIFIAAVFLENGLLKKNPEKFLLKEFQKKLLEKEKRLDIHIEKILQIIGSENFKDDYLGSLHFYNQLLDKEGFGFLVYENSKLMYWSDQVFSFDDSLETPGSNEKLVQLPNGYYLSKQVQRGNHVVKGLILIKTCYPHENEYLQNTFQKKINLPEDYLITESEGKTTYPVVDSQGNYQFSVLPAGKVLCTKTQLRYPGILYFIALILLLVYARREFKKNDGPIVFKLFVLAWVLFVLYWLHILFQFPKVFYILDFFSPDYFAYSIWLPSLGDYSLASLFIFFWALNFSSDFNINQLLKEPWLPPKIVILLILFMLGCFYLFINFFIQILIENSSFNFSLNHITELSVQSVVAYFSIGLLLMGLAVITIKITEAIRSVFPGKQLILFTLIITTILAALQFLIVSSVSGPVLVLYFIFIVLLLLFTKDYLQQFTLSYLIILISVFSVYSLFIIYNTVSAKEREVQRLFAINLVTEHDPAAELFLTRIQYQIIRDSVIPTLLIPPFTDLAQLDNYIVGRYFGGFFRKYDVQVTACTGADSLDIQPENITVPCFPYFDERIEREGLQVEGTNFYFMDNMSGRITYFGKLHYPLSYDSIGISVFIELNSSIISEGIGYPELLLDKSMKKPDSYNRFHYAKYIKGQLVDQHGDFMYNQYIWSYDFDDEEYSYRKWDRHEHIIYHTREDNYVVVSRGVYSLIEYLISFPYLFVFYFLIAIVFLLSGNRSIRKKSLSFDLKFKVQASIISIVLLSLLVVAIGTVFYNVEAYKTKHRDDLNEKMKSIAEEIEMNKERVEKQTPENLEWLFAELIKLSNIFRTDINIYGVNGELISTSRPEIYEKGLISKKMNSDAYFELNSQFRINFSQPEKIGELSYLSAYQPIFNGAGKNLGFINLPYFTRQDKYSQEITTFIVAFINLYVILFLASIIVAVFISNQITKPLTLIRENLRKMELGKRSEPINYSKNDEIGSLVKEYNKKVDELAASAELLARSERESAWREMAKQIAHEIKNPLTPMKLNIQYLQRLKGDPKEQEENIEKVTKLLIEQIDDLSSIATEFSNFAKMPAARNQIFNLAAQMQKVIDLFETHDKANIRLKIVESADVFVNVDREQFSRAIINLIKNAIQAIPSNLNGLINIYLTQKGSNALIRIEDNGIGIAEDLQEKMFSPSFTTKTSGMGLGLAIVKNIVENFKGRIWFVTKPEKGTTFFIEIPVYENSVSNEANTSK